MNVNACVCNMQMYAHKEEAVNNVIKSGRDRDPTVKATDPCQDWFALTVRKDNQPLTCESTIVG